MSIAKATGKREKALVPVLAARDAVHFPSLINTLSVARPPSVKAIRRSMDTDRRVLVLSQRDMSQEDPGVGDLHKVGTLSEALQALPMPDTSLRVVLRGNKRARAVKLISKGGTFWAEVEEIEEVEANGLDVEAIMRACVDSFSRVVGMNKLIPPESMQSVSRVDNAGLMADTIAHHLPLRPSEKQALLEEPDNRARLNKVFELLKREEQILDLDAEIRKRVERELGDGQREYYLREQLKVIQTELQAREQRLGETEEYRRRIEECGMPAPAVEKIAAELRRLDRIPANSPEGMVLRNYLDCLVELPWQTRTEDRVDVGAASELLDQRHYGLEKVKNRILDYLAVRQLRGTLRGPVLCFVGPPGVGKTSIARSIAEAMGRKFVKLSLGGIRDEAEIRGHRRTYVGSMPGRLIQGFRHAGAKNPLVVLDEIDKMGSDFHGDPTAALMEALDPEQNSRFSDHYIEVPFDLSEVMFVATANLLENIPAPLRDRMEVIRFPSYTDEEREQIAGSFLVPKAVAEHGIPPAKIVFGEDAIRSIIRDYTRESGVRNLDRAISAVCRKAARKFAEGQSEALENDMVVWDPFKPLGGNTEEDLIRAKFILWKGHCSVHKRFTVEQIEQARREYPGINVLVHPECTIEVVQASDFNGSTEFIIKTVQAAEPGSKWAIGTEINLVSRLAKENPDKTIFCLDPQICPCSTMYRIHPSFLCWVLENLVAGNVVNQVKVPDDVAHWAKVALTRMLTVCA